MKLYVITQHWQDGESWTTCPIIDTARLTLEEAEAYVARQESLYQNAEGESLCHWNVEETDCPLGRAREAVTVNG